SVLHWRIGVTASAWAGLPTIEGKSCDPKLGAKPSSSCVRQNFEALSQAKLTSYYQLLVRDNLYVNM
ncbi:hypothetical protein ACXWOP_09475, partial [Streptococcus pyogenes]